jgi:hypothetical protein
MAEYGLIEISVQQKLPIQVLTVQLMVIIINGDEQKMDIHHLRKAMVK